MMPRTQPQLPDWGFVALGVAIIAVLVANIVDIGRGREGLKLQRASQERDIAAAKRAETQLYALARGTRLLADGGNANAVTIVGLLRQNGISIDASAPTK